MIKRSFSISLLCICSTLLFCVFNSYAATTSDNLIVIQNSSYSVLDSYFVDSTDGTNYQYVTYEFRLPIIITRTSGDGFVSGYSSYSVNMAYSFIQGPSIISNNLYFENTYNSNDVIFGFGISNTNTFIFRVFYNNFNAAIDRFVAGNVVNRITLRYSNPNGFINNFNSVNTVTKVNSNLSIYPNPQSNGLEAIIKQSIIDALTEDIINGESVYDLFQLFVQYEYNTNASLYRIEGDLNDILDETIAILGMQSATINKIQEVYNVLYNSIYSEILTYFPNYSQRLGWIIDRLDTLIHMGESDTAYQDDLTAAESQLQEIVNDLDVYKPSQGQIINPVESAADIYASDAESLFFYTWDGRITSILILALTLGVVGFVLYGKSG